MDNTSKRDIYDLIAELAKSANMDIDGTEFVPGSTDVRRKPLSLDFPERTELITKEIIKEELAHLERSPGEEPRKAEEERMEELGIAKASSLEELNKLKAEAIEELKLAKEIVLYEMKHLKNGMHQEAIPAAAIHSIINKKVEEIPIIETPISPTVTLDELNIVKATMMEELNRLKNLQVIQKNEPVIEQAVEADLFENLTIDDLNRITMEAMNEGKNNQHGIDEKNAGFLVESKVIQDQLKLLNEKLDEISHRDLKSEIVNELKLSDERIVQQVQKTRESILNDISPKPLTGIPRSKNSMMKWLGILNLLLLLIVLMYLCFQKFNQIGSSNQSEKKPSPTSHEVIPEQHNEPLPQNTSTPENNSGNETGQQELVKEQNILPQKIPVNTMHENNAQADTIHSSDSGHPTSNHRVPVNRNMNIIATNEIVSNVKRSTKNNFSSSGLKSTIDTKKNETITKNKTEVSKKTATKQDVYFGED